MQSQEIQSEIEKVVNILVANTAMAKEYAITKRFVIDIITPIATLAITKTKEERDKEWLKEINSHIVKEHPLCEQNILLFLIKAKVTKSTTN